VEIIGLSSLFARQKPSFGAHERRRGAYLRANVAATLPLQLLSARPKIVNNSRLKSKALWYPRWAYIRTVYIARAGIGQTSGSATLGQRSYADRNENGSETKCR
jgi:hypothetical protein